MTPQRQLDYRHLIAKLEQAQQHALGAIDDSESAYAAVDQCHAAIQGVIDALQPLAREAAIEYVVARNEKELAAVHAALEVSVARKRARMTAEEKAAQVITLNADLFGDGR